MAQTGWLIGTVSIAVTSKHIYLQTHQILHIFSQGNLIKYVLYEYSKEIWEKWGCQMDAHAN